MEKSRCRDYRRNSSPVVRVEVVVKTLHDPPRHIVVDLIADILPTIVEKQCVPPVFTDVALVCRAHHPAGYVVSME